MESSVDDENEEGLSDDEDIFEINAAKGKIASLLAERQRKTDYMNRMQEMMRTLNKELGDKREEVENLTRTLDLERNKHQQEAESRIRERQEKIKSQNGRVRDYLSEVLYSASITGPKKKKADEVFQLTTVLITFIKPGSPLRYNLTYRIDDTTRVAQLRADACKYWGVDKDEFILKTMMNSKVQDDMLVKDSFKQGEIAQLLLMKKTSKNMLVSEAETKAVQPKTGKRRRAGAAGTTGNEEALDVLQALTSSYENELRKFGGAYLMLKLRDLKPSEHANKIRLRDILIFTLLGLCTAISFISRRPSGQEYWFLTGVRAMLVETAYIPEIGREFSAFTDIETPEEVWNWLEYSIPNALFRNTSQLREFNDPIGYMQIRQQRMVKPTDAQQELVKPSLCETEHRKAVVKRLGGGTAVCYPMMFGRPNDDEKLTEKGNLMPLQQRWNASALGTEVRGLSLPWKFVPAETNSKQYVLTEDGAVSPDEGGSNIWPQTGTIQTYDSSGYQVDYNMESADLKLATFGYQRDIRLLRNVSWIDAQTRMVSVSLSVYNYVYEMWASMDFLIEFPPSGQLRSMYTLRPFRPNLHESTKETNETYLDYIRLICALVIFVAIRPAETKHKQKNHKPGYIYLLSLNGVCDLAMMACTLCVFLYRAIAFGKPSTLLALDITRIRFYSWSDRAYDYEQIMIVEGVLFVAVMFRSLSMVRLNRRIYLLWHTIGEALKAYLYFALLFIPVFIGFCFFAHNIWGQYVDGFDTLAQTTLSLMEFMKGDIDFARLGQTDVVWTAVFMVFFFLAITFFMLNVFIAIFIDSYYTVQLTAGYDPSEHSWGRLLPVPSARWIQWFCPTILMQIHQALTKQSKPKE